MGILSIEQKLSVSDFQFLSQMKFSRIYWKVWEDIEGEMETIIRLMQEILFKNPNIAQILDTVPQVQIPVNLPPQILQQAIQNVLQQI